MRSRLGIVAGILVAGLALGYAALHLPPARRLALRLILTRLERSGIIARAGGLDYNLATFEFHLKNLTLATPTATADPFFAAQDVRVRLTPGILFGDLVLKDIAIDEPRVFLTTVGASNWPAGSDTPSSSPRIRIEHARVTGLTFRWLGPQSSADFGVSFELTANGGETAGRITATRPAALAWRDHRTSIETLDGRLSWNGADLGIAGLSLRLPEGTLTADGRIEQLTAAPRLDMHVVADADLAVLAPWFDVGRAMSGTSRADVTLTGPLSGPDAAISLTGRDVAAEGVPPASLEAAARVTGRTVELTSLRARLAGGSISATGQASFDGPGAIRAEWHDVDLAAVLRDVLRDAPSTTRVELAARLSGTLDARWTAPQLEQLELTADAQAVNDVGGGARSLPVAGSATFALRALGWQLSTDDFGMPGARVSGRVGGAVSAISLSKSSIEGSIHIDADDVSRLAGALARSGQIQAAPDITGNATADFTVSGLVGAPSLDGPVRATIGYESLAAADLRAQASIAPDAIRVQEIDARLGASTAQGDLEWSRRSDALGGMVNASVAIGDLTGLSATFPRRLPLDGRVGVSASLFGTLAHARATIAASSAGLDVAGQHIDRSAVEVSADLERSRFVIDRLTMQSGSGRIDGRGEIDLTRDTYAAHLVANDVPVSPFVGLSDSDVPLSGRLNGSFDGEGSFDNLGGRGRFSMAATRWKEADLGSISADVTLEGRNASVSAEAPDLALKAGGSIGVVGPAGAVAVRGEWAPREVAPIAERLGVTTSPPVGGSAHIRFELNGTRDRLDELRSVATLDALDITVGGQPIRLSRPGQIEYDGRTVRAGNVTLSTGMSTLVVDGSIGNGSTGNGSSGGQSARGLTASLDGFAGRFRVRERSHPASSERGGSAALADRIGAVAHRRQRLARATRRDRHVSDRQRRRPADGRADRHRHRASRRLRRRHPDARFGGRVVPGRQPHGVRASAEQRVHRPSACVPAHADHTGRRRGVAVGAADVSDAGGGCGVRRPADCRAARRPGGCHGPARSRSRGARSDARNDRPRSLRPVRRGRPVRSAHADPRRHSRRPAHGRGLGLGAGRQPHRRPRRRDARRRPVLRSGHDVGPRSAPPEHPDAVGARAGPRRHRDPDWRDPPIADARRMGHLQQRRGARRQPAADRQRHHGNGHAGRRYGDVSADVRLRERR